MKRIIHITNFGAREKITDGGTNREEALARVAAEFGAQRLVVQDSRFKSSKLDRLLRLRRLMREVQELEPEIIILNYPSYPFFWQHRVSRYYGHSIQFSNWLGRWALRNGARVVVDVMDMPLFQHKDLGYKIEMSESRFRAIDHAILVNADHIWFCSSKMRDMAVRDYDLNSELTSVVVNGSNIYQPDPGNCDAGPFRFVYCGSLARERGTASMIQDFVDAQIQNTELHLAGQSGEWIKNEWSLPDVFYHGQLTDQEAAELAANCDVGLIYYPQQGYYHLAYATKLPFYVCSGIPVLCTDVQETGSAVTELSVGRVVDISRFGQAMAEMAQRRDLKSIYANSLESARERLTWDSLYSNAIKALGGS